eukprot:5814257-Pleurochrysis_carterae.AAC.1
MRVAHACAPHPHARRTVSSTRAAPACALHSLKHARRARMRAAHSCAHAAAAAAFAPHPHLRCSRMRAAHSHACATYLHARHAFLRMRTAPAWALHSL